VEDERKTAEALQQGLEDDGYSVEIAHTGEEGFFRLNSGEFDLAILDVMLPGRTGVEVLIHSTQNRSSDSRPIAYGQRCH